MKKELADLYNSMNCVRERRDWLDLEDVDGEEQTMLDELFILAVKKMVDFGHHVLMAWDQWDETVPPKKRKTKK